MKSEGCAFSELADWRTCHVAAEAASSCGAGPRRLSRETVALTQRNEFSAVTRLGLSPPLPLP